ncbi:galectin-10-like [Phacochoerus africanus]|uniref:galectin-10-like n=1 Tax=Phacochoerus africanus TaxID=41426 RepID=UPI001FDA7B71|nr:galectin-10-like [Phacochoerus africanus]
MESLPSPYGRSVSLAVGWMVKIKADLLHPSRNGGDAVVMSSFQEGGWREAKRASSHPFVPGQPLELRILVLDSEYQVLVNNRPTYIFGHYLPPQSVKMMQLKGDVLAAVEVC